MLDYLPQALAIFRRLAEKEPERYRARIAELEPLVRRNRRTFRLFTGLFLLFAVALCVLLPAGLLYWIVRAGRRTTIRSWRRASRCWAGSSPCSFT